jgi:hypothetical protein
MVLGYAKLMKPENNPSETHIGDSSFALRRLSAQLFNGSQRLKSQLFSSSLAQPFHAGAADDDLPTPMRPITPC